jgi:hypothetical protein
LTEKEQKQGWVAVKKLVLDSKNTLEAALQELALRDLVGGGWCVGALGVAAEAVGFVAKMIDARLAMGRESEGGADEKPVN